MTDQPYTEADLRTEAARHVGSDRDSTELLTAMAGRAPWMHLSHDHINKAHAAVQWIIDGAADTSMWAVDIGADALDPDERVVALKAGGRTLVRIYVAFEHTLTDDCRADFIDRLGENVKELF